VPGSSTTSANRWFSAAWKLLLIGALAGFFLDAIHTHTDTTGYKSPWFFRGAWWVFPLFGGAGVAIGLSRPLAERLLGRVSAAQRPGKVALGFGLFVVAYALSGVLSSSWLICTIALGALFAIVWWICDRSLLGLVLAAGTAPIGVLVESSLVRAGVFWHVHAGPFGVSHWLPWLYAIAAIAIGNLGRAFVFTGLRARSDD
jgi:hypothetical protein